MRNIQFMQHTLKSLAVFSAFNSITTGTNDLDAMVAQRLCKIDGCLTTQRSDDTFWFFQIDDVQNIFHSQRLKVELVRACIVSGDSFRVVINDDCFIACLTDGHDSMNSGVVKFNALTDTDRSGTQNDDLTAVRNH
ncbi:hypothetical protein EVA_06609 [gut metagenome]|uniref:Uncharacterized protein n=1 Tax=gut metagenome TaxID=749906 RepID=J9GEF5_9ZZZZ